MEHLLIALAVVVGVIIVAGIVLVAVASKRPAEFAISRNITMAAPPKVAFDQVNDFHKWAAWSPWEHIDPNMKREYGGSPSGVGAVYAYDGNKKVGAGRMTILESKPGESIKIKLEFLKPFVSTNTADFTFKSSGAGTAVTWTMSGRNDKPMAKVMCMFMNMDKMIGPYFEKGLASMKQVAEAEAKSAS